MRKQTVKNLSIAVVMVSLMAGASEALAWDRQKTNNAASWYNVGKASFNVSTHAIGTAPKPNPVVISAQLGLAARGFATGARDGYGYQSWKKPEVISSTEGARTLGYSAGVVTHRIIDGAKGALRRR